MLRIIRIALLTLVPALALGTLVTACSDDTTSTPIGNDMSVPKDMTTPNVHDLANPHD